MADLIIVRHGESEYNAKNLFTGSVDTDLTKKGIEQARHAGMLINDYPVDVAFTSGLKRAQHSLQLILDELDKKDIPVKKADALNERNYGDLQGMNKLEAVKKFGARQVQTWRRSFSQAPPGGESLKETVKRVTSYYKKHILPDLKKGKNVLIVAHGNSLRALMMYLENISEREIPSVELATGLPRLYEFDDKLEIKNVEYMSG